MININLHIEYLLRRNDCVIIPGIGAFIAFVSPARYDYDSDTFLPPVRSIVFNAAINSDDGLLASSYSLFCGRKFGEAHAAMQRDIDALRNALETYSAVQIGAIGSLFLTEDGRLTFQPRLSADSVMSQLGCRPISLSNRITEEKWETLPKSSAHSINASKSDKYYYIPVHKTFVNIAASIIAILAVTIGVLSFPHTGRYSAVQASVMPIEKVLRLHSNDFNCHHKTPGKTESHQSVTIVSADNQSKETLDTITKTAERTMYRYNLVVGAFTTPQEADRYVNSNTDDHSLSIEQRGRHFLVVYASSDDRRSIIALLNSKEIADRYNGAWIWETKK